MDRADETKCGVCEALTGHPQKLFCSRCDTFRRWIDPRTETGDMPACLPEARVRAMQSSWSVADGCFRCHYSGVRLVEEHSHPAYPTFDLTTPRDGREVEFVATIINNMKALMGGPDFKAIVIEMGKRFQGLPFDQQLIEDIVHRNHQR